MKRILLLLISIIGLSSINYLSGQEKSELILLSDFESGFPDNFTLIERSGQTADPGSIQQPTWGIFTSGNDNHVALSGSWFNPPGRADDWMIVQDIVLSDDAMKSVLLFKAESASADYPETMELLIDTGNSADPDSFELVSTLKNISSGSTMREYNFDLSDYLGDTISVAFRNVSNDKLYLIVDDIGILNINSPSYVEFGKSNYNGYVVGGGEDIVVSQSFKNLGAERAQSIKFIVTDGVDTLDFLYPAIGIGSLKERTARITLPGTFFSSPGTIVTFKILEVNGVEVDPPVLELPFAVIDPATATPKLALAEMFTSSSCSPCRPGNQRFQSIIDNQIDQEVHYIKVQQNFPGYGDPYTTPELIARRTYYGINAVPELRVDGTNYSQNPNGMTAAGFKEALNQPAFVTFDDVKYTVEEKTVTVKGSYTPLSYIVEGTKLMAAIVEDTTYKNTGGNGEHNFLHVVKKYIGGLEGFEVDPSSPVGEPQYFELSYTFNGNYRLPINGQPNNIINHEIEHSVEDFSALSVSVWVENDKAKLILNSAKAKTPTSTSASKLIVNEVNVYPLPTRDYVRIDVNLEKAMNAEVSLINMNGVKVKSLFQGNLSTGVNTISADLSDLMPGNYIVELRSQNIYHGTPLIIVQ